MKELTQFLTHPDLFCSGIPDQSFWFTIRLLTEPWEWLVDYSTKANVSYLTQLTSPIYLNKKYQGPMLQNIFLRNLQIFVIS